MSKLLTFILDHEDSFRRARLPSLYSDLAVQKITNPDGYAANIAAWQQALTHAARAGLAPSSAVGASNLLVLQTSDDLVRALADSKYGRPMGLNAVLDDAVLKGSMMPLSEFLDIRDSIYTRRWFLSPWQLLDWGLRQVGLVSSGYGREGVTIKAGDLVILANVEDVGRLVMDQIESTPSNAVERVVDVETFRTELTKLLCRESGISDTDMKVLLRYLERDKAALSCDGKTIKFKTPSAPAPEPITQQDTTIASLKTLIAKITSQCSALEQRISTLHITASTAIKSKSRTSALSALRSKKLAEKNLKQRSDTLHQLEEVFSKITQAADQVDIIRVMKASAGVLKGLNKQIGGVERVEDVIEDLREEMGKTDEVTHVINEGGVSGQVDDDEIDDELERMEKEQNREMEEKTAQETKRRLEGLDKQKVEESMGQQIERLELSENTETAEKPPAGEPSQLEAG